MFTDADILAQLDRAAEEFRFADPEHAYSYAIDARLHAFRDDRRWALIIDLVGYNPRQVNVVDVLYCFGNCLTEGEPGPANPDFLDRVDNMDDVEDEDEPECLSGADTPIVIRGVPITVEGAAGESLENVFRRLVPDHRELLLADDQEIRRRIPADLPRVLVLQEWFHRRIEEYDAKPSTVETFQQLARVLVTGDLAEYRPSHRPNTHWSNWPESGSL